MVIIATEHRTCQEGFKPEADGTSLILLANSDSHFSLQKSINIIGDAGLKTQDAEDSFSSAIQCLESCFLSLESCVLCLIKSDYFHYLVWIAEPFNTNVLQHFHQKIMITSITYTLPIHYYMHYLAQKSKTIENPENCDYIPKTDN